MKTLAILGGMSHQSTAIYYHQINDRVHKALGANHSARLLVLSVDFETIAHLQRLGDWQTMGQMLATEAKTLEQAGADGILLATNTMHKVAHHIQDCISMPFLHLLEATAQRLEQHGIKKVGLLGTRFTMSDGFYQEYMARFGIEIITPTASVQDDIHRIIFDELCVGVFSEHSRTLYQSAIAKLGKQGAAAVIFGCTEIGLLLNPSQSPLPVFDSTQIHIETAVDWYLS